MDCHTGHDLMVFDTFAAVLSAAQMAQYRAALAAASSATTSTTPAAPSSAAPTLDPSTCLTLAQYASAANSYAYIAVSNALIYYTIYDSSINAAIAYGTLYNGRAYSEQGDLYISAGYVDVTNFGADVNNYINYGLSPETSASINNFLGYVVATNLYNATGNDYAYNAAYYGYYASVYNLSTLAQSSYCLTS